jgi:hypothetical protein
MILIAVIIAGAYFDLIPKEGEFNAPPLIILSLSLCLLTAGLVMFLPQKAPLILRGGLGSIAILALLTVCNWTAFAPGITFTSSTTIGPLEMSGEDPIGGRIVFGLVAIGLDVLVIGSTILWLRKRSALGRDYTRDE